MKWHTLMILVILIIMYVRWQAKAICTQMTLHFEADKWGSEYIVCRISQLPLAVTSSDDTASECSHVNSLCIYCSTKQREISLFKFDDRGHIIRCNSNCRPSQMLKIYVVFCAARQRKHPISKI
jgi:hypothetical protein